MRSCAECGYCGAPCSEREASDGGLVMGVRACFRCRHERGFDREFLVDLDADIPASESHYNGGAMPDGWSE